MELLDAIFTRRSIRRFTGEAVTHDELRGLIKAATYAPSGLNNQPWRFVSIIERDILDGLSGLTKYASILRSSPSAIAVFINRSAMYNEMKDYQAIGACIQNLLLAAHAGGLGAVWLGEILKNSEAVSRLLSVPEGNDLMAVIAIGHPNQRPGSGTRKNIGEVILREI